MLRQVTAAWKHFHADTPHSEELAGFGNYAVYYGLFCEAKFQKKLKSILTAAISVPLCLSYLVIQVRAVTVTPICSFRHKQWGITKSAYSHYFSLFSDFAMLHGPTVHAETCQSAADWIHHLAFLTDYSFTPFVFPPNIYHLSKTDQLVKFQQLWV